MPTSAESTASFAVDTSVAVAFLDAAHSAHDRCVKELSGKRLALAGHAAFETFSVLTRMPGSLRVPPADAFEALSDAFPEPCWLNAKQQRSLLERLGTAGMVGGMVYDALVGEAARVNGRTLFTRDRRAIATYDLLGVTYAVLD